MTSTTTSCVDRTAQPRGRGRRALPGFAPAGLALRASCAQGKAWLSFVFAFLLAFASAVHAATPPNATITNTAAVAYDVAGTTLTGNASAAVTTASVTPAAIQFLSYVAGVQPGDRGTTAQNVAATACLQGGAAVPMSPPVASGVGTLPSPGAYPLAPASAYSAADTAFIQVVDYSANQDPAVAEPIVVTVSTAAGDSETLRLLETGPSTGVFVGYVPLRKAEAAPGNCRLEVRANEKLVATYVQGGSNSVSVSTALADPLGLVFDSSTGQPVDGVRVTLIDVATGQPASVFGDDGVSAYPSTVLTGSTVTDGAGKVYVLGPGRYQFPRVNAPGTYRLQIEAPNGYSFPSKVADAVLQQLQGAPYVLSAISRGAQFTVLPGPPVEADLPLDVGSLGSVQITKTAGKATVGIGDFVPYTVNVATTAKQPLPGLQVLDRLPPGFRYRPGSARLNGAPMAEPQVSGDGRSVVFSLGTISARAPLMLTYVTVAGASVVEGPAQNTAQAIGRIQSNVAGASVLVREDMNRSRAILAGQVTIAPSCEANDRDRASRVPLAGVRILLEDGTYVLTDRDGNWHVDNVLAGSHVVQVDTPTLPRGMPLQACDAGSRSGGRDFSQLVTVHGGTLWRADFRFAPAPTCLRQSLRREGDDLHVRVEVPVAHHGLSATLLLPAGVQVDASAIRPDGDGAIDIRAGEGFVVLRARASKSAAAYGMSVPLKEAAAGDLQLASRADVTGKGDAKLAPLTLSASAAQAAGCAVLPSADLDALRAPATAPVHAGGQPAPAGVAGTSGAPRGLALVEVLPYDDKWLAAAQPGTEWLHPREDFQPALPAVKVVVKHAPSQVLELRVNGRAVDPLRFEGVQLNPAATIALSEWRAVELRDGANALELVVRDAGGAVVQRETRSLYYGTGFAHARFDAAKSTLVADGREAPVVAVRFTDGDGKPARRGLSGEFNVDAPYAPRQAAQAIQRDPLSGNVGGRAKFEVGEDGVALIALQPTTQSGEAVLRFDVGGGRQAEVRAWLKASQREWVLVGFAEGTFGHKVLSGNMQALKDGGVDQLFDDNRLAFYAKGTIRGDYLLTAAYDTAKQKGQGARPSLRQAIDPNAYYTLYGDATQQQYDASSIRNLYLKIEKQQFYLLFGDFNTGLTVTELARYSRTLNGLKSEFKGETFSYNAFAARTTQAYWKDEIQADGTSGLYRLRGRNILPGTDKARIETRDRFQAERVLNSQSLAPWLDYQIDYAAGTILLRQPVAARDADGNPQLLVVEYESDAGGAESWTYGGRAAAQVGAATLGVTRVHEGDGGREGTLTGADATLRISDTTKAKVEVATSKAQADTAPHAGTAYVAEVLHDDGSTQARAYARQQAAGFGLGQQSAIGSGQRRIGVEGRSKLSEAIQVEGELSRAEDSATGASRDIAAAGVQWQATSQLKLKAGVRAVEEQDGSGGEASTRQVTAGASYEAMEQRLVLRAATELDAGSRSSIGATTSYPNRLVLGVDYKLTASTTLAAQQEFASAGGVRQSATTVGLRTGLWQGAELRTGLGRSEENDASRLYANLGLVQRWQLGERWTVDAGLDRVHTLSGSAPADVLGPAQVPTSGTVPAKSPFASVPSGSASSLGLGLVAGDYTAVSAGLAYRDADWSGNGRLEWRGSSIDRKVNALVGLQRKLAEGQSVAAGIQFTDQAAADGQASERLNARASYAFRPAGSDWMVLERFDYVREASTDFGSRLFTRKLINNLNANYKPHGRMQVSLQYSIKLVRESLQEFSATSVTDLVGIEARYDLTRELEVGVNASLLRTHASGQASGQYGVSAGYRIMTNTWIGIGYNFAGFWDADFTGAQYRAKGVYLNLRTKFDQDTFGLNERGASDALPSK